MRRLDDAENPPKPNRILKAYEEGKADGLFGVRKTIPRWVLETVESPQYVLLVQAYDNGWGEGERERLSHKGAGVGRARP